MGDYNDAMMRNQNAAVQARTKAQGRANVLQLKMIGQSHPTGLTPNLLKLFEPRPPLEYRPPPEKGKCPPYHGMAQFVSHFAEPGDPEYAPPVLEAETRAQRRARVHQLRLEKGAVKAVEELEKYDPQNDPNASGDPYKTLFVARLSYETSESRLKREFETYGPIKRVKMVYDKDTNKPKGYAFIEFAHTRDMKSAYKQGDGRKIDGRRVLVDVERGRTVPNWRPRRLGGGLGTSRVAVEDVNREVQSGGVSQSAEPRIRDDREREKSRERGRDKEREREVSRERSHDRPREREDRHHRDRERTKDRDRDRDRGHDHRDRDHGRSRDRDRGSDRGKDRGRGYERERDRDHERGDRRRERNRDRDYDKGYKDHDRGRSHDKEYDYDQMESKNDRDRHGEAKRSYDDQGWYEQADRGHKHSEAGHDHYSEEKYDQDDAQVDLDRYDHQPDDRAEHDQMEEDYN